MLREVLVPVLTVACCAVACVGCLDRLAHFYQAYQRRSEQLESERWLRDQCRDPLFFSRMHTHTDLCLSVENNARVGAFMLALREMTQHFLTQSPLLSGSVPWPVLLVGLGGLVLLPSGIVRGSRRIRRSWDEPFKEA